MQNVYTASFQVKRWNGPRPELLFLRSVLGPHYICPKPGPDLWSSPSRCDTRKLHKYVFLWSELRKSEPKSQVFPTRAQLEPNSSPTRAQNSKPEPYPSPNYLSPFQLYWQKPKKSGEVTVLTENEPPLKRPQLGKVGAVIKANFPCLNWLVSMLIRATATPPRVTSFQIGSCLLKFFLFCAQLCIRCWWWQLELHFHEEREDAETS